MSDDGEIEYPLPPEEEVGASDAQRAGGDAEAVRRASKERRETIVPAPKNVSISVGTPASSAAPSAPPESSPPAAP